MRQLLLSIYFLFCLTISLHAQTGCPGCVTQLPPGLPTDTVYLPALPAGEQGKAYNEDISFRMPRTTTPVAAIDSTIPPGFPISKIEIVSVDNLPPGLKWEASQLVFETASQTDGCIKICGTPSQSDTFILNVKLKATVFFLSQEASFPMKLYIAPEKSTTDGFSMSNYVGCGSTTVTFTNNIPSNGVQGFSYDWDFGDSTTFSGENPPPHKYSKPGIYPVNYHASIDTAGFTLESITVLAVDCVDQLGVGAPDLYALVKDPAGMLVANTSPAINNTGLPHTFPIGLSIDNGNFTLEVWDEDSGLKGTDDPCGSVSFNLLSNDTLVAGNFKVVLNIVHPIQEIFSIDSVVVLPVPVEPKVSAANGQTACVGSSDLVLESSYGAGNQWLLNGAALAGATDFIFEPNEGGYYQVQVSNFYGCTAVSDSVLITFNPLPLLPVYNNYKNKLRLTDTLSLPAAYTLQWYQYDAPIAGATGFQYCAMESADYGLLVTNTATGCSNFYESAVVYDPNFDCTTGTGDPTVLALGIFPNPAQGEALVRLPQILEESIALRVWDARGQLIKTVAYPAGLDLLVLDCTEYPAGIFTVGFETASTRLIGKLVVLK